ncbi:ATP-binding cassette domain-containing protein [Phytohabitans sp. ZYX-F-186]|uniref:ATP-binding cassette domain-containing protein n=1 Tax=Phytohabitans maris TaxID=3071409 RepID=A0ABU0ZTL2_9ACTN|nr:oligopeptide/dipeptide ABC transporter ATP-binding protein [Phytohabitans sp. ZYX-F-186]MDQ7910381.1 ATP-binding cassette domain-containing protein [Phytohabitans sp. ZYX-F-186]
MTAIVLSASGLRKHYRIGALGDHRTLVAVDDVDLEVRAGETVALVGESGSGKSTVARCLVHLVEPTAGEVRVAGEPVRARPVAALTRVYRDVQMVFQDPNSSLDPRMTVRALLAEPLRLHLRLRRRERDDRVRELVEMVGLRTDHLDRYPHQLSGGQRQRVGIARALAVRPRVVILDEPTSSLDVSVRGQILDLLARVQRELRIGYLFITHDLAVVRRVAHRVLVMYLGGIVEQGPTGAVFARPVHPYTRALLSAAPVPEWGVRRERFHLTGEIPSPVDLPDQCRLVGRCPLAVPACAHARPPLVPVGPGHAAACPVETSEPTAPPRGPGAVRAGAAPD